MRDLTGGKEESVRDDALRIRTDGGRRLVRVNDLQAHNSLLEEMGSPNRRTVFASGQRRRARRGVDATRRGDARDGEANPRRLVPLPAMRDRREVRRVRFDEDRGRRARAGAARRRPTS